MTFSPFSPFLLTSLSLSPPYPSKLMKVNQDLKADKEAQMNSFLDVERQLKRKLSELQEVRKLDAQAKQHLEDSYRAILEEEKEKLSVLQMQVRRGERE